MGWEIEGTDRKFEINLEKFIGAALKVINWDCVKIIKIIATENEIFVISVGFEEIFEKFNQSKKL